MAPTRWYVGFSEMLVNTMSFSVRVNSTVLYTIWMYIPVFMVSLKVEFVNVTLNTFDMLLSPVTWYSADM